MLKIWRKSVEYWRSYELQKEMKKKEEEKKIIRKDKTKTERFPTKVGNLNNKKRQNENRKVSD